MSIKRAAVSMKEECEVICSAALPVPLEVTCNVCVCVRVSMCASGCACVDMKCSSDGFMREERLCERACSACNDSRSARRRCVCVCVCVNKVCVYTRCVVLISL
jgi:hypothetical protein